MHRILVVEDNGLNSMLFAAILARAGFDVDVAQDLGEAERFLELFPLPSLILTDISLPDGSGLVLAGRVRAAARTRHIPVIAVSGSSEPDEVRAATDAGCAAYLVKPVSAAALTAAVFAELGIPGAAASQ